jgi:hypothetical protein
MHSPEGEGLHINGAKQRRQTHRLAAEVMRQQLRQQGAPHVAQSHIWPAVHEIPQLASMRRALHVCSDRIIITIILRMSIRLLL